MQPTTEAADLRLYGRCLNAPLSSCFCVTGVAEITSLLKIFALQLLGCATSASPAPTLHFTF